MTHQNVPTTFLPGASGFLGHYCLRDLLRRGRRVVAMLRPQDDGEPDRTNIAGTQAIIDWATHHGVNQIHAVSTAYTCGWNGGTIREALHHPSPAFQTDYERTKWQAEIMLSRWAETPGRVLTILRPSLLIGDSESGHT